MWQTVSVNARKYIISKQLSQKIEKKISMLQTIEKKQRIGLVSWVVVLKKIFMIMMSKITISVFAAVAEFYLISMLKNALPNSLLRPRGRLEVSNVKMAPNTKLHPQI